MDSLRPAAKQLTRRVHKAYAATRYLPTKGEGAGQQAPKRHSSDRENDEEDQCHERRDQQGDEPLRNEHRK